LNLPSGKLRFALQRLVAVGTIKFEFVCVHGLHLHHAQTGREKYMKDLLPVRLLAKNKIVSGMIVRKISIPLTIIPLTDSAD
jgi:hypothetical protein